MSLDIGTALREGFHQLVSRTGAILVVVLLVLQGVSQISMNSLLHATYVEMGMDEVAAGIQPVLGTSLAVAGAIAGISFLLITYLNVVAIRTFVAGERGSIPRAFLTDRAVFAVVNFLLSGFILAVLLTIGFALLLVPGVFLLVSFLFVAVYVAAENDDAIAAMRHSWELTEGERWSVFGLVLVVLVLGFALGVVMAVLGIVGSLASIDRTVVSLVSILVVVPFSLYNLAVVSNAFHQLREEQSAEPGTEAAPSDSPSSLA